MAYRLAVADALRQLCVATSEQIVSGIKMPQFEADEERQAPHKAVVLELANRSGGRLSRIIYAGGNEEAAARLGKPLIRCRSWDN